MTAPIDPLPAIIAARITGAPNPFLYLKGKESPDGRTITIDVIRYELDVPGDRTTRILMHLSPEMPVKADTETASSNGAVDPVTAGGAA